MKHFSVISCFGCATQHLAGFVRSHPPRFQPPQASVSSMKAAMCPLGATCSSPDGTQQQFKVNNVELLAAKEEDSPLRSESGHENREKRRRCLSSDTHCSGPGLTPAALVLQAKATKIQL